MKAAIIGTTEYHKAMRQITANTLQRVAGFIAPTMPVREIQIESVHESYLERVDAVMQALADDSDLVNCNPRSPYLMLAWLLVGSDNPYRSCQYVDDTRIHRQVAIIHIRIALGDTPVEGEINAAGAAIKRQVLLFSQLDDYRALCIARQLTLDILGLTETIFEGK